MKISSKITLSFAVVLALIVMLGLFALIRMDEVNQASTDIAEIYLPSTVGVLKIQIDSSDFRRSEMQHILSPDRAAQQRYETKMSESKMLVENNFELVRKLLSTEEERTQFEKITNNWNSYLQESNKIIALSRENKNDEATALLRGDSKKYFDAMDEALKVMEKSNTDETNEASAQGDELYASSRLWVIVLIVGALIISSFAGILTYRAISVPLGRLQSTMQEIVRDNNMTLTVKVENRDEIGITAEAFNTMMGKLRDALQGINGSTTQLAAAAEELAAVTQQTTDGVLRQQQETDQVATAMNEMSATVQEVSQNAVKAAEMAHNADDEANRGRKVVTDAVNGIQKLAAEVERSAETINRLQAETASIGSVLDVIQAITEQTNLLALNAAIEAARAGEHGRGFAVVADEVRTLAQRTQESTKEIQTKIERLQIASREAVSAMESGRQQATTSVSLVQSAGSALSAITSSVASINDMNALIASAAEEQSSVANEIDRNITNIARVSDETANGAQQTSATSEELAQLAAELQRMVNQFRLA